MGKAIRFLKQHLLDNTISLASVTPFFAGLETLVLGMPVDVSLNSKFIGAGISYAGVGVLFVRGRDRSRTFFGITPESKNWKKSLHDYLYTATFNAAICPIMYLASGSNIEDMLKGTGLAMALSCVSGPIAGYAIDAARDLHETLPQNERPPERLPAPMRALPKPAKRSLYAAAIAGLIGLTALVYSIAPKKNYEPSQPAKLDQRVEQYGNGQK